MPQIFRPYADSAARATLVTLLLGPFAIAGLASWTMRSNYITTSLIRQSRSTSCRSVTPITSAFWPRLPLLPRRGRKVDGRRHSSDRHLHDVLLAARARGLPDESGPGERASASHPRRGACSESHSCCADVCRLSVAAPLLRPCRREGRTLGCAATAMRHQLSFRSHAGGISSIFNHAGASSLAICRSTNHGLPAAASDHSVDRMGTNLRAHQEILTRCRSDDLLRRRRVMGRCGNSVLRLSAPAQARHRRSQPPALQPRPQRRLSRRQALIWRTARLCGRSRDQAPPPARFHPRARSP